MHRRPKKKENTKKNCIKVPCFTKKTDFGMPPMKLQNRKSTVIYDTFANFPGYLDLQANAVSTCFAMLFNQKKGPRTLLFFSFFTINTNVLADFH